MENRFDALDLCDEASHDQRDVGKFRDSLGRRSTEKLPNGIDPPGSRETETLHLPQICRHITLTNFIRLHCLPAQLTLY